MAEIETAEQASPAKIDPTQLQQNDIHLQASLTDARDKVTSEAEAVSIANKFQDAEQSTRLLETSDCIPHAEDGAVENIAQGVAACLVPELSKAKSTLAELNENQRILIETIQAENAKFAECKILQEVTYTMQKAQLYHTKLVNIKKDMIALHETSAKLKKRALKLQQQKQKEALVREQEHERELEKERHLIAKTAQRPWKN